MASSERRKLRLWRTIRQSHFHGIGARRLRVDRFDARAKLSQNKTEDVRDNITSRLAADNPAPADEMRRH